METPHRTLDLEDWSRVTQGLVGGKEGTMGPRVSQAVEKACRIAEYPPGIFQLATGIGPGDGLVCRPDRALSDKTDARQALRSYAFKIGLSRRREITFDYSKTDIAPFIADAIRNPKRTSVIWSQGSQTNCS